MKAEFNDWTEGFEITFKPDTKEELLMLMRYANNAKAEKPFVWVSFGDEPYCYIHLKKISESVQNNTLKPKHQ